VRTPRTSTPNPWPHRNQRQQYWQEETEKEAGQWLTACCHSDILHPNRANVSKDELRAKLSELYKSNKDQVSVFGLRTQYGGGKTTGFALIYDSGEAMKRFEPHYRLVRYGQANKIEKASRQQRMSCHEFRKDDIWPWVLTTGQASSARTGRRSSAVPPRPRVARRTRNKRFATTRVLVDNVAMGLCAAFSHLRYWLGHAIMNGRP